MSKFDKNNLPNSRKMRELAKEHAKIQMPKAARYMPSIVVENDNSRYSMDPFSYLLKNRVIFYTGKVDEQTAELVNVQLLYLEAEDPEKDISLYIDSPGGEVYCGSAVINTMDFIMPDVVTICNGKAMSMGAMTLLSGAEGKRYTMPDARIMIHQPLGGGQGQATDIEITANEITKIKLSLYKKIALRSGMGVAEVAKSCERDKYMTPREALLYGDKGLIDGVIIGRKEDGSPDIIRRDDPRLDIVCPSAEADAEMLALIESLATEEGQDNLRKLAEIERAEREKAAAEAKKNAE